MISEAIEHLQEASAPELTLTEKLECSACIATLEYTVADDEDEATRFWVEMQDAQWTTRFGEIFCNRCSGSLAVDLVERSYQRADQRYDDMKDGY